MPRVAALYKRPGLKADYVRRPSSLPACMSSFNMHHQGEGGITRRNWDIHVYMTGKLILLRKGTCVEMAKVARIIPVTCTFETLIVASKLFICAKMSHLKMKNLEGRCHTFAVAGSILKGLSLVPSAYSASGKRDNLSTPVNPRQSCLLPLLEATPSYFITFCISPYHTSLLFTLVSLRHFPLPLL